MRSKTNFTFVSSPFSVVLSAILAFSLISSITATATKAPLPGNNGTGPFDVNNSSSPMLATYSNSTYGVNMTYPAGWKAVENISSANPQRTVYVVELDSPAGPSLTLAIDTFNTNESADAYIAESVQGYRNSPSIYQNFTLIKTDTFNNPMLGGNPAYHIWYSTVDDNGNLILNKEIGTVIANKVYFTTYTAPTPNFALYEPIADQIAQSLVISTNQTSASNVSGHLVQCPSVSCLM